MDEFVAAEQGQSIDNELMAFARRRRQARIDRDKAQEATEATAASPGQDLEFVEVVREAGSAAPARPRVVEAVIVEEVDPKAPKRIGEIPPSGTGAEMPSADESYAIRRVNELRMIASATPSLEPTDETLREAADAMRINVEALEYDKPAGPKKSGTGKAQAPKSKAAAKQ